MLYSFYHKITSCIFAVYLTKVFFYNVLGYVNWVIFFTRKLIMYLYRGFIIGVFLFFFHKVLGWDVFFVLAVFLIRFAVYFVDWFEVRFFFSGLSAKTEELAVFFFIMLAIVLAVVSLWIIKIMVIIIYVQVTALLIAVGRLEIQVANILWEVIINYPETMFFLCGIGNFLMLYVIIQWEQKVKKTKWVVAINVLLWSWYTAGVTTGWVDKWAIGFWLTIGTIVSVRECYKTMYEYLERKKPEEIKLWWLKTKAVVVENLNATTSIVMTVGRIMCQVVMETASLRYGMQGGYMLTGGPGMFASEKFGQQIREILGIVDYKVVNHVEALPPIPETPPKNMCEFVSLVANDPVGMNESPAYNDFKKQYEYFQTNNRLFRIMFPDEWKEFVSSIRGRMLDAHKTGHFRFNMMIPNGQIADYLDANGRSVQSKTVRYLGSSNLLEIMENERLLEGFKKQNVRVEILYQEIIEHERILKLPQTVHPHYLKNNIKIGCLQKMERITPKHVQESFEFHKENKKVIRECKAIMNQQGYVQCGAWIKQMSKIR